MKTVPQGKSQIVQIFSETIKNLYDSNEEIDKNLESISSSVSLVQTTKNDMKENKNMIPQLKKRLPSIDQICIESQKY